MRKNADATETQLLQSIGAPIYLDGAVALSLGRVPKAPTVIVGTPLAPELPKLHPEWTVYTNGDFVNQLLVQGDTLWAATSGGVMRWDTRTGTYSKLTTENGLANNRVKSIMQSRDRTLWFGTDDGVSRLDTAGHWTIFTTKDGLAGNYVNSMLQSADGALWFGTDIGMSRYQPQQK